MGTGIVQSVRYTSGVGHLNERDSEVNSWNTRNCVSVCRTSKLRIAYTVDVLRALFLNCSQVVCGCIHLRRLDHCYN